MVPASLEEQLISGQPNHVWHERSTRFRATSEPPQTVGRASWARASPVKLNADLYERLEVAPTDQIATHAPTEVQ